MLLQWGSIYKDQHNTVIRLISCFQLTDTVHVNVQAVIRDSYDMCCKCGCEDWLCLCGRKWFTRLNSTWLEIWSKPKLRTYCEIKNDYWTYWKDVLHNRSKEINGLFELVSLLKQVGLISLEEESQICPSACVICEKQGMRSILFFTALRAVNFVIFCLMT